MKLLGIAIALALPAAAIIALLAAVMSTKRGRSEGILLFGLATAVVLPVVLGMFVAGNPGWITGLGVIAGLDLLVAVTGLLMFAGGRIKSISPACRRGGVDEDVTVMQLIKELRSGWNPGGTP